MRDDESCELAPLFARNALHQIQFDALGVFVLGEAKSLADADHVRIHCYAFILAKARPQNDGCRLPSDTLERGKLLHCLWHFAVMMIDKTLTHFLNETGFVAVRPTRMDIVFQLSARHAKIVARLLVLLVERLCDNIHPCISALGAQNGRDEEVGGGSPGEECTRRLMKTLQFPKDIASGD